MKKTRLLNQRKRGGKRETMNRFNDRLIDLKQIFERIRCVCITVEGRTFHCAEQYRYNFQVILGWQKCHFRGACCSSLLLTSGFLLTEVHSRHQCRNQVPSPIPTLKLTTVALWEPQGQRDYKFRLSPFLPAPFHLVRPEFTLDSLR